MMNSINSTNLTACTTCDLNTRFNNRCQSDWSQCNLISIVSQDGIYILKPQPEIQNGPFEAQLIRNPTNKFTHKLANDELGPTFDKKWSVLDSHQYMQVFLDPALATHVSNMSLELYPRRFRMAKWSPVVQIFPKECILAALTTDYQLLIYVREHTTWMRADLSAEFDAYPIRPHGCDKSFESIRSRLHSVSFCNICWHERSDGSILLLASTIPGDIIFWRLEISAQAHVKPTSYRYKFIVEAILGTNNEHITCLQIEDNLLIVSARSGQVVLYDLTNYLPGVNHQGPTILPLPTPVSPTAILCSADNLEVLDLYLQRTRANTFSIVLSKSTNICWCTMNYVKHEQENLASLTINDSFSALDVSSPATWLRPAGHRRAVYIADDGSFFKIEFPDDQPERTPDFEAVRTGKIDLTRLVPRGLCTSTRGKLIAMISSISLLYDPSKIVAPTKVTVVPSSNDTKSILNCMRDLTDEAWIESQNIESIMDVHDSVDAIRSIFSSLTEEQHLDLYKTLRDNFTSVGEPKNETQMLKAKITAFLISKLSRSRSMNSHDPDYERIQQDLFRFVLTYYIREVLTSLTSNQIDLNQDQVNSLRNYSSWLKTVPNGKHVTDIYSHQFKVLESSTYAKFAGEQCPICQSTIGFDQPNYGTCAAGHRFARCARSLLIIDLQKGDKLLCEHCRRQYLARLVWPLPANLWLCIYCQ